MLAHEIPALGGDRVRIVVGLVARDRDSLASSLIVAHAAPSKNGKAVRIRALYLTALRWPDGLVRNYHASFSPS
jgi:hypothetical protein